MFDVFRNYLEKEIHLSDEDYELIQSYSVIKKLRKHQYLLQEGDHWNYNAFVCSGFLRKYTIDEKGNEHTVYFSIENWWTGDRQSLMDKTPSTYNIDAVENTTVLLIHETNFQLLMQQLPAFKDLVNKIFQRSLSASHERINVTISLSAEEKYKYFLKKFPKLAGRIPLHMLASYLGMTRETLSRIRKGA